MAKKEEKDLSEDGGGFVFKLQSFQLPQAPEKKKKKKLLCSTFRKVKVKIWEMMET